MVELILSILYNETTVSLISLATGVRELEICISPRSKTLRLGLNDKL